MLRIIIIDYGAAREISPSEYMKTYIEKCPETTKDTKIAWIAETFLGIQKHVQFLKDITSHISDKLSEEDQDYFLIIFYAVTFQIQPKYMQLLYKCLFNLSKPLLMTFTRILSNNEILIFMSQVAETIYDTNYITEKIIAPLFAWQPYISEMEHSYTEYVKKIENRKLKPNTVPIHPKVLDRKCKESVPPIHSPLPATPPNSLHAKNRKMLTKNTIDRRLNIMHEKNKQKAANLLNDVKSNDFHYAQTKSDKYYNTLSNIKNETENASKSLPKPKKNIIVKDCLPPIRDNIAAVKRMNKRIISTEQEELQWLQNLMTNCRDTTAIEELEARDRQEREKERLIDIERKHLLGQISFEEAVIAKRNLQEYNKKKYEEFLKERKKWNQEIEMWKKMEVEKNRKKSEKLSLMELNIIQAKNESTAKKKELADNLKKESQIMLDNAMKEKQKELESRINIIKEIKILAMIAKRAKVPKIIDLTETSGLGLLCEMSMAELQERLNAMKICLQDELKRKKEFIKEEKISAKQDLEVAKKSIQNYMAERAELRKQIQKPQIMKNTSSKELNYLKKILEEKRKMRNLTS